MKMKKFVALMPVFILLLLATPLLATPVVTPVLATANTKVLLIQDVAPGGNTTDADMVGPTGFGFVNFNQNETYDLRITIAMKNVEPNTEYTIYLVAGPTHATAMGYIIIGTLLTNVEGNGNSGDIIVELSTLQASPFGPGDPRTDHIDILGEGYPATAGGYVAAGIDYYVPPP